MIGKEEEEKRNAVTRFPAGVAGPAMLLSSRMEGDNWVNCSPAVSATHLC